MRGRYFVCVPAASVRNEKQFDAAWGRFADLCRWLHRDGLNYDVLFNLSDVRPHVLVTASGTAKPRRATTVCHFSLPQPVPVQKCRERALEAAWFLPENSGTRNTNTAHWQKRSDRHAELTAMSEELLRAEHEYWRELELLSGRRDHFKPGRTDETANLDDEVAA